MDYDDATALEKLSVATLENKKADSTQSFNKSIEKSLFKITPPNGPGSVKI